MGRRITITIIALACLLLLSVIPSNGSAFPYQIEGYLKDSHGDPVPHATLRVTGMVYNITSGQFEEETAIFPDATSNSGYYRIAFGVDEPGGIASAEPVTLSCVIGNLEATSTFTLEGDRMESDDPRSNLVLEGETNIWDFFTTPIGIAMVIVLVFVLIIAIYWYTSREEEEKEASEEARTKVGRRRK